MAIDIREAHRIHDSAVPGEWKCGKNGFELHVLSIFAGQETFVMQGYKKCAIEEAIYWHNNAEDLLEELQTLREKNEALENTLWDMGVRNV